MTKVGIISDTHDNVEAIQRAMRVFKREGVDFIIHCGDVVAPKTVEFFRGISVKFVLGNCDGDVENLEKKIKDIGGEFLGDMGKIGVDGKTIMVFHGHDPVIMRILKDKKPDYLLTGHTHIASDVMEGGVRILNPGGHYGLGQVSKVIILDVGEDKVEFVEN